MEFLNKIIDHALAAVEPEQLINDQVTLKKHTLFIQKRPFDLTPYHNLHVIGAGKGAVYLFHGLDHVLGPRLSGGVIVGLPEQTFSHPRVTFYPGSHPIPDQFSLTAGYAVTDYIKTRVKEKDLVFFLLTGGASALMVQPVAGLTLADKTEMTHLLLASGAQIQEINCIRKTLSAIKGGKLAEKIYPARIISLIVSDIIDSPLADIGSGPTIPTHSTLHDAYDILEKYKLTERIPPAVQRYFKEGLQASVAEKKTTGTENVSVLLADNRLALAAAQQAAQKMGIETHILYSDDHGEAAHVAKLYAAKIKEIMFTATPYKPPVLLLSGGELTVTLNPPQGTNETPGKGGRNQEFVLRLLKELSDVAHPFYIASIGTDGIDGPTDAAGGWIDQDTMGKTTLAELDKHLKNHDSYRLLAKLQQLIKTGPTRTNVMDLRLFYIYI